MKSLDELVALVAILRDPERGCAFDLGETIDSHAKLTLEEVHEFLDAVNKKDWQNVKEELGDLLFHVVLYAQIAKDEGLFDLDDIASHVTEKMHRRHPHVFGPNRTQSIEEINRMWAAIKAEERKDRPPPPPGPQNYDFGPASLPSLVRMDKIARKSAEENLFWSDIKDIIRHIREELDEIETATSDEHREEEVGDAFVALASLAYAHGIDSERALQKGMQKFMSRWQKLYELAAQDDKNLKDLSAEEIEAYWRKVK